MRSLRSWLLSFLLATVFAAGVVAIVIADPSSMLDEEDQHTEDSDRDVETLSPSPMESTLRPTRDHHAYLRQDNGRSLVATLAPTREHRIDLHRPPSV